MSKMSSILSAAVVSVLLLTVKEQTQNLVTVLKTILPLLPRRVTKRLLLLTR